MRDVCVVAIVLLGCNPASTTVNLDWTCAWENNSIYYGTMELQIALEGENQGPYGGGDIVDIDISTSDALSGSWHTAPAGEGVDYRIIRIAPSLSGSTAITTLTSVCPAPCSIAYDSNPLGYPLSNIELSAVDSLSAACDPTYLLQDEWNGSRPALSRTAKIDVSSDAMHTSTFAPGGWWGELRSISLPGGALASSWWLPVNGMGPMASDGATLYVIQKAGNGSAAQNRLYAIGL